MKEQGAGDEQLIVRTDRCGAEIAADAADAQKHVQATGKGFSAARVNHHFCKV